MAVHTRTTSVSVSLPTSPQSPDLHHRPPYAIMSTQTPFAQFSQQTSMVPAAAPTITPSVALPPGQSQDNDTSPMLLGMPLKYVSLITLAVQNAALTIIMHHSRVSTPPSRAYSAASAVLLNELLKGAISLAIAVSRIDKLSPHSQSTRKPSGLLLNGSVPLPTPLVPIGYSLSKCMNRFRRVGREVFSDDCWKLAIPAILYVIQNNLQYVAAANLDVATFTVTYQMKILTTAAFSVMLLRRKLGNTKWLALFFLAIGVGIVQLQAGAGCGSHPPSAHSPAAPIMAQNATLGHESNIATILTEPVVHSMQPLKGFLAVTAACFTSGLAGVYFEMVLKGSKADLWIRNVQLSLFSLLPALIPIIFSSHPADSAGWFWDLFRNFGLWAWATVAVQVFGGLVTAVVIKYSDNILKGFATSLSIIISFLASVALFDFRITPAFVFGSSTVLVATFMYNRPTGKCLASTAGPDARVAFPGSPVGPNSPILGQFSGKKRFSITKTGPHSLASALGLASSRCDPHTPLSNINGHFDMQYRSHGQPHYSEPPTPSPPFSHVPTRPPSAPRPALGALDIQNFGRDNVR